ncbi:hypothetical protein CF15_04270 [Pyrodictium occultum]|uniref:Uncharacterized protein n=1 Tax=Pyrodictium occultum TaxID=2309 RepID=A0A0V8RVE9_PYROC|nr:hypothetical protein [Pyrodictium occultum]KSW12008.1 hypothetical protein CF15_04270 [Pyrodictium occultum]
MSLVLEEPAALESLAHSFPEAAGEGARGGLSIIRFMADVRTVAEAFVLGGGLEGARLLRIREDYRMGEIPRARVLVEFEGLVFYLYAKPYIDVEDVDVLVDEAGELAERLGAAEVVPVAAAYQFSYDAERYARSIDVETVRLGL